MIKLIIRKIDERTISIQNTETEGQAQIRPAVYLAFGNPESGLVTIKNRDTGSTRWANYSEIEVDELGVLESVSETVAALNNFIGNFSLGGSSSSTTGVVLSITKTGINGAIAPSIFSWTTGLKVSDVLLMSNAAGIAFQIGDEAYDGESILDVALPAGTELLITDIEISAGYDTANVIIIFKKIK
jgi:hypothetical protein